MAGDEPLATFKMVAHLDQTRDDFLAFTSFRREVWRQSQATRRKRLNKEIRRRTGKIGGRRGTRSY
jgi:transposase-like protein